VLKNVSLRNELLCLGCERNCGARAAEVSRSSYRTELGSVAVLSLSLSHTHAGRQICVSSWHARSRIKVIPMRVHFRRICARLSWGSSVGRCYRNKPTHC